MSLISEALRKAQLEAVQQDREQRRFYMNHGGRSGQPSPGISRTSLAILVLAAFCILSAGALLYLTMNRSVATPAGAVAATARPAVPVAVSGEAKPAPAEDPASSPLQEVKRVPPRNSSKSAAAATAPAKARTRTGRPAPAAQAPVSEVHRATERRLERDGFREGETYGSPVLGPLGTEVVLSGITALRGQHVAIINGTTIRAGTAVGPFVVEDIEPRRVRLKYVDITFYVVQ